MEQQKLNDFEQWTFDKQFGQQSVYIVKKDSEQFGFFKFRYQGLHLAVDYLVSKLARDLGLNTPDVALDMVNGKLGILSLSVPLPHNTWAVWAPAHGNYTRPSSMYRNPQNLVGMFVLDVWVGNTDRNGNNIMLHEVANEFWDTWAIDHGHCFSGLAWISGEEDFRSQQNPEVFFLTNPGFKGDLYREAVKASIKSPDDLLEWVDRIRQLGDKHTTYLQVCQQAGLIGPDHADKINEILTSRREDLETMFRAWTRTVFARGGR